MIVDVLSFSHLRRRGRVARVPAVLPYRWKDESAADFAKRQNADSGRQPTAAKRLLALADVARVGPGGNASGASLAQRREAELCRRGRSAPPWPGACETPRAVARFVEAQNRAVAVIACGERWNDDDSLRPAWEDLVGAGAVIDALSGSCSPDAQAACDAFLGAKAEIYPAHAAMRIGHRTDSPRISRGRLFGRPIQREPMRAAHRRWILRRGPGAIFAGAVKQCCRVRLDAPNGGVLFKRWPVQAFVVESGSLPVGN